MLAVQNDDGQLVPLPAALWLEVLGACLSRLAGTASERDPTVEDRYAGAVARELLHLLKRPGRPTFGPVRFEDVDMLPYVFVRFAENTVLLVGLAAAFDGMGLNLLAHYVAEDLLRINPGHVFRERGFHGKLPGHVSITRLLVAAPPSHGALLARSGVAGASLDDIRWIIGECVRNPDDIYLFLRDLADPPNIEGLWALETINAFEHWRRNQGSFARQGRRIHGMWLPPHRGHAEWYQSSEREPLERALAELGLKPTEAWDAVFFDPKDKTAVIGDFPSGPYWALDVRERVVAIRAFDPATPSEFREIGTNLAEALRWRYAHSRAALEQVVGGVLRGALTVVLVVSEDTGAAVLHGSLGADGRIELSFGRRFLEVCQADAVEGEVMAGAALGKVLEESTGLAGTRIGELFLDAWKQAPQGLRLDLISVAQSVVTLPPPRWVRPAELAKAHRDMATRLMGREVAPGTYSGSEAMRLENEHVRPVVQDLLHEALALFSFSHLLRYGLVELERCFSHRFLADRRLGLSLAFPVLQFDPVERAVRDREAAHVYGRSAAIVVEELLSQGAHGQRRPDAFDWGGLMGAAQVVLESGLRSENHRYRLRPMRVEISEEFGVTQEEIDDAATIDFGSFQRAHAEHTLPATPEDTPSADNTSRRLLEVRPGLRRVDEALLAARGFGIEALFHVLWTLRTWPVSADHPIATVATGEIAARCAEFGSVISGSQLDAAVKALTVSRQQLAENGPLEHWEQERRPVRLATHPLVAPGDGSLIVCPWLAEGTWRILGLRLGDGRLLWPEMSLPQAVVGALKEYRGSLNNALEQEMAVALSERGFRVRSRIKKPGLIGLETWHGEIDAIAVDERRGLIWVLEAKDLVPRFAPATIERSVRDFHGPGRYVDKLLAKLAAVETAPQTVARSLGAPEPDRQWALRALMVTRRVEPAAFYRLSRVQFCTVDRIADFIGMAGT